MATRREKPVTVARIDRALDTLAEFMVSHGADGRACLPLYQKLEREAERLRAEDDAMARVRARIAGR